MNAPVATVTLRLSTGESVSRTYMTDEPWPAWMADPPAFLSDLRKEWPKANEPIQFTATVIGDQCDAAARELLTTTSAALQRRVPSSVPDFGASGATR